MGIVESLVNLGYEEVMYDFQLPEESNHRYYTNGILSHNTAIVEGLALLIVEGKAIDIFKKLHDLHPIKKVFSHQETGINITYNRDKIINNWLQSEHKDYLS